MISVVLQLHMLLLCQTTLQRSMVILTPKYGYLGCMFALTIPGTEQCIILWSTLASSKGLVDRLLHTLRSSDGPGMSW